MLMLRLPVTLFSACGADAHDASLAGPICIRLVLLELDWTKLLDADAGKATKEPDANETRAAGDLVILMMPARQLDACLAS